MQERTELPLIGSPTICGGGILSTPRRIKLHVLPNMGHMFPEHIQCNSVPHLCCLSPMAMSVFSANGAQESSQPRSGDSLGDCVNYALWIARNRGSLGIPQGKGLVAG